MGCHTVCRWVQAPRGRDGSRNLRIGSEPLAHFIFFYDVDVDVDADPLRFLSTCSIIFWSIPSLSMSWCPCPFPSRLQVEHLYRVTEIKFELYLNLRRLLKVTYSQ